MKVLLVEDNSGDARLIQEMLRRGGAQFELTHVRRLSQSLQRLGEEAFDVILLDLGLPDSQGIDTFDRIHAQAPDAPVVVLSGTSNEALAIETVQHGAQDYLVKGQVDRNPLLRAIRYAVERKQIEKRLTNEKRLQDFLDNANELIQSVAPDGRLLCVNRMWLETLGYTQEEVDQLSLFDVVHPDSLEHCMEVFQSVMSGEKVDHVEAKFVARDGRTVVVEGNVNCRFEDGRPVATRGIFRDVTEHKRIEDALKESEETLRTTFETMGDGITITDIEGRIVSVNDAMCNMGGWRKEELIGRQGFDFIAEQDRDKALEKTMQVFDKGSSIVTEYRLLQKDGREYPVEASATLLRNASGDPVGLVSVARDVTERKRMEQEIKEREEKLSAYIENAPDAIYISDLSGRFIDGNNKAEELLGYTKEELVGKNFFEAGILPEEYLQTALERLEQSRRGEPTIPTDFELIRKDGSRITLEIRSFPISKEDKVEVIGIARDVTERKRIEKELIESEEKLKSMFASIKDPVIVADMAGNILEVNDAALRVGGWSREKWTSINALEIIHEKDRQAAIDSLMKQIEEGDTSDELTECTLVLGGGREVDSEFSSSLIHDSSGQPIGTVTVARDITERKRMEETLRERIKELNCLYSMARIVERDGITLDAIYQQVVDLLATSWHHPEIACSRIVIGDREFRTHNFRDSKWKQSACIRVHGTAAGKVDVCYLEERPELHEGPFLREERSLLDAVAERLGRTTERKRMEEELRKTVDKLNILFASIADGIVVSDMNGTIIEANEAAVRIAGLNSKDEVLNKNGLDFISEEDRERVANDLAKALFEGSPVSISQYSLDAADGRKTELEVHTSTMRDSENNPVGFIVVERDITERRRMEKAIQQYNKELVAVNSIVKLLGRPMRKDKMLQAALNSVLDVMGMSSGGIWLVNDDGGMLTPATYHGVSPKFKKSTAGIKMGEGITGQAAEQGEVVIAPDFLRDGKPGHINRSPARLQGLQSIIGVPLKMKGKALGVMTLFEHGCRPFSPGDIQLLETIGGEIGAAIESAQLLEKLSELSVTDELTGLYNRRRLYEVLDAEVARTQRYGHPFSLVIIDLDGFKQYNDTYGHVSGDVALEDFASALMLTLRKTDIAFRHGGDEFAVILPYTDACKARKVIRRLRTRWEQVSEVRYKSLKTPIGFSAGIAQLPGDAETADGLLAIADITMYHAKELGKYRTELASASQGEQEQNVRE